MTAPAIMTARPPARAHRAQVAQIALPLDWSAGGHNADWPLVGPANADVIAHCQDMVRWHVPVSLVIGAGASGKSTIARWFAAGGGRAIDDADRVDDRTLFHAFNDAMTGATPPLLLTAGGAPILMPLHAGEGDGAGGWRIALPDLGSRLAAIPVLRIGAPDPPFIAALIDHLFAKRGIIPAPGTSAWCAARIERSFAAVVALVDALDAAALGSRRAPSIPLARAVLADAGLSVPDLFDALATTGSDGDEAPHG